MANGKGQETGGKGSAWADLLRAAGQRLVPLVISTGSLLTFVAFAGAVIVWTRLNAVEVAPDQAITAFPRGELVAIGASLLLLYGFFGALAVLGAFLIDRGGRPTQGMAYGLLFLLTAEGVTAIMTAADFGSRDWAIATLLFAFPVAFAAWATSLGLFSELRDELHRRPMESQRRIPVWGGLRPTPAFVREGEKRDKALKQRRRRPPRETWWERAKAAAPREVWLSCLLALVALIAAVTLLIVDVSSLERLVWTAVPVGLFALATAYSIWNGLHTTVEERDQAHWKDQKETRDLGRIQDARAEAEALRSADWDPTEALDAEYLRLARKRPLRLYLTWPGIAVAVLSLLLAAGLPAWELGEPWLGIAMAAAAMICMWLWRVAIFTRDKTIWFGLAVFLSVPLFGTFMTMARNLDDPQIQPIALIRSTDGPDEAIQGLYVTEAKNRVYFATVATEGCTGSLRSDSGRLLWVPKDEVVAMSIGPLQSVEAAAKTSLEMAFALTPVVETPSGESVSLTTGEARSEEGGLGEDAPLTVQRLEHVGPAVRPTFGRGVKVTPVDAQPKELVTLTMSTPIEAGFGERRDGRNLRVGGVPAQIRVNPTADAVRAEYARTNDGERLVLDKTEPGVYVRDEDETGFVRDDDASKFEERFVRLAEGSGVVATSGGADESNFYLRLAAGEGPDRLAAGQTVTFSGDGDRVLLERGLWRQAWNKDEIKFYVPEKSTSGTVTVDCEQLAGQPLLRVERPPEARLAVRPVNSGRALVLDGHRSSDDGKIEARRWSLDGRPLPPTDGGKTGTKSRAKIGPRPGRHRIRLAVEDKQHEVGAASLYVLRVPEARLLDGAHRGGMKRLRSVLIKLAGREDAPSEIWVYGFGRGHGKDARKELVEEIEKDLLTPEAADRAGLDGDGVQVNVSALGRCGSLAGGGSARRRLDIFVAAEGVRLLRPSGCPPRPAKTIKWSREEDTSSKQPASRKDPRGLLADLLERLVRMLREAASAPSS